MTFRSSAATLILAATLAGCRADQSVAPPASATENDGLFLRYISLGNSIAAGFQSAGINDSTQRASFAVLFAQAAGTPLPIRRSPGEAVPHRWSTT
jgi:hypothetical protein